MICGMAGASFAGKPSKTHLRPECGGSLLVSATILIRCSGVGTDKRRLGAIEPFEIFRATIPEVENPNDAPPPDEGEGGSAMPKQAAAQRVQSTVNRAACFGRKKNAVVMKSATFGPGKRKSIKSGHGLPLEPVPKSSPVWTRPWDKALPIVAYGG
jgi:hypothetical protein